MANDFAGKELDRREACENRLDKGFNKMVNGFDVGCESHKQTDRRTWLINSTRDLNRIGIKLDGPNFSLFGI